MKFLEVLFAHQPLPHPITVCTYSSMCVCVRAVCAGVCIQVLVQLQACGQHPLHVPQREETGHP